MQLLTFLFGVLAVITVLESPLNGSPMPVSGCSVSTTSVNGVSRTISTCVDKDVAGDFRGQIMQQWVLNDLVCVVGVVNDAVVKECKKGSEPFHPMTQEEGRMIENHQKAMEEKNKQIQQQVMRTQDEVNMRMRDMRAMQNKMQQDINLTIKNMNTQMANMQSSINQQISASLKGIFMGMGF